MTATRQQTAATIHENADLNEALNFKKTPAETDKALADYFAEKAAKAAKREKSDEARRQAAYEAANQRHPLPLSGTHEQE